MEPTSKQPAADEQLVSIDYRRYLRALRKYKWLIAALMAVAVTATVIHTGRQTKIYAARASMLIDPAAPQVLGNQVQEVVQLGAGNFWSNADYYNAQVEILSSYELARRTVEMAALHRKLLSPEQREELTDEQQLSAATHLVKSRLKISYPEKNRVVYVEVEHEDPKLAALIANAHVDAYIAYNLGLRADGTGLASKWLAKELDTAEGELLDSEHDLFEFKKENDILSVSLEDRQNLVTTNIARFTDALNDARTRRIELGATLERMHTADLDNVLESPVFSLTENSTVEQLKVQYYLELNKLAELETEIGPRHPKYLAQKKKVDDLYAAIGREARLTIKSIEEKYKATKAAEVAYAAEVERYKQEAFALGPKAVDYNRLTRRQRSNERKYDIVLERLRTSDLTGRLDTINVRPLDPAVAAKSPVRPNMRRNVIVATAIALFLGIGLAILLDFLDRTVKSAEDIESATNAPLLGVIPSLEDISAEPENLRVRDMYVAENPTSRVAECCRSIRTNIMFSGADRELRTLVVSSPNPREGKTTTVMYLGTTMAQSGQRVLVIDSDMRRPRLHQSTGVSRGRGLSNLVLREADFDDVIKSTDVPNLYVLPCGPTPPNPAELLMTNAFHETLAELEKRFDRILLDSPPLLAVTDAVVLAQQADGIIMVAKAGKTIRDDVARAARQLSDVKLGITGVVLNELDLEDRQYGYYYQYYGYGYGPDKTGEAGA